MFCFPAHNWRAPAAPAGKPLVDGEVSAVENDDSHARPGYTEARPLHAGMKRPDGTECVRARNRLVLSGHAPAGTRVAGWGTRCLAHSSGTRFRTGSRAADRLVDQGRDLGERPGRRVVRPILAVHTHRRTARRLRDRRYAL